MGAPLEEADRRLRGGALDERAFAQRQAPRRAPQGHGRRRRRRRTRRGAGAAMIPKSGSRRFVALWTLATIATVCAFLVHLALRGRTVGLGYELGRERAEQARLREVKRVLEVEAASYKTPERVEIVARTLLGMEPPSSDRVVPLPAVQERPAVRSEGVGIDVSQGRVVASSPPVPR